MAKIKSLWHITHVENLSSVLKNGIYSRGLCNRTMTYRDIADPNVVVHHPGEYAPVFFADNTPMLYVVFKEYEQSVVLLEIDTNILRISGVKFSDGNVTCNDSCTYDDLDDLERLDWGIIYNRRPAYWKKWRRIRAAEVLVPNMIPADYIRAVHASPHISKKVMLITRIANNRIQVYPDLTEGGIS